MIAFLIAAALAASPPPAQPSAAPKMDGFTTQEVAYARSVLIVPGWNLLSATHDLVVFYKGAVTPAGARLWIRGEHYPLGPDNPIGNGESFVTLYELDCTANRVRTLSSTIYSGAKMQGDIVAASDKAGEWTAIKPGGFTAMGSDSVCHGDPAAATPEAAGRPIHDESALAAPTGDRAAPLSPQP